MGAHGKHLRRTNVGKKRARAKTILTQIFSSTAESQKTRTTLTVLTLDLHTISAQCQENSNLGIAKKW